MLKLKYNLFLCCTALDKGFNTISSVKNKFAFSRNGQVVCTARKGDRQGKRFKLKFKVITLIIKEPRSNIIINDILIVIINGTKNQDNKI